MFCIVVKKRIHVNLPKALSPGHQKNGPALGAGPKGRFMGVIGLFHSTLTPGLKELVVVDRYSLGLLIDLGLG